MLEDFVVEKCFQVIIVDDLEKAKLVEVGLVFDFWKGKVWIEMIKFDSDIIMLVQKISISKLFYFKNWTEH